MLNRNAEIQKFLLDAEYPMSRNALVILAEGSNAPEEALKLLESTPDVIYESSTDLQEALNEQRHAPANGQHRSRKREIEQHKQHLKDETGKLTEPGKTVSGEPDHRLKGQETEALRSARHMEHGYDGRGQITNPDMDARLSENRAKADEKTNSHDEQTVSHRQTWKQFAKK